MCSTHTAIRLFSLFHSSRPALSPRSLPPPFRFSGYMLPGDKTSFFFGVVVFAGARHSLLFGKAHFIQIFGRHELMIHPTLQIRSTEITAFVMHVLVGLQTRQVGFHGQLAFGAVIEWEDPSLRWNHHLFGGSHAHSGHDMELWLIDKTWWKGERCVRVYLTAVTLTKMEYL